ncbi:hypothetical protein BBK82_43450 [Lentzea guizhouensis]|uniref:Fumarate lyase N-terminal domain-containing protein n=1 Tax=Lentzea guizhouensis TaxID=1586287 RepID=A0A1B2HVS4_9PSEU|nr:lyase family protein [Lentzea guizhouensis]ANZ41782.1 hypothetical protein BBK82_43450 [Lentzea guizhouensis]
MVPGSHRAGGDGLVRAMVRVEVAWARVLGSDVEDLLDWTPRLDPAEVEAAGNPVLPLVSALRSRVSVPVHTGLTSQDVLDTALVLVARDAVLRVRADLARVAGAVARLADEHRGSVMAGRTLTQHAVPITFGLKAARWLDSVLDALEDLERVRFPVQCGGAAGTLSRAAQSVDPLAAAAAFARELDLEWPGLPWHTQRAPVTRISDALVRVNDALGVFAADVLTLGRPEIAEVREGAAPGRGGSSTMPHKRNPVLAVLVNSASLRAPGLGAQLHLCAARAVDERPDGAWHAEWPALLGLVELTVVAASQAAELAEGLRVFPEVMARRAAEATADLLAERGGGEPADLPGYLGAADAFVDHVLERAAAAGLRPLSSGEPKAPELTLPGSTLRDRAPAEPTSPESIPTGPPPGGAEVPTPIVSEGSDRNGG